MPKAAVNGVSINYRVRGQGEPLVLIMGYSGPGAAWWFQERAFARHFRVVTFDNRGVGKSDKPEGPYTTAMMGDDAVGLMDHLGIDKAHVMGVSMGGLISQELALNHPDRVMKLVLGCTYAGRDEESGFSAHLVRALHGREDYTDDDIRDIPIGKLTNALVSLSFSRRLYRLIVVPLAKLGIRLGGTKGLGGQLEACLGHNALDRLSTIQAPTLVIAGTGDRIILPGSSDVLASKIPNAKLVKVEGGSHSFFVEMRGKFNREVMGFLRGD